MAFGDATHGEWRFPPSSDEAASYRPFLQGVLRFCLICAALSIALSALDHEFPYIKSGAALVLQKKRTIAASQPLFDEAAQLRVIAFGNSRTMAGFIPNLFDHEIGSFEQSFNLGLPGEDNFMHILEGALVAGTRPTHIFLQIPPIDPPTPGRWLDAFADDHTIVERLFPFRTLPRDAVLFLFEARQLGLKSTYDDHETQIAQMIRDKGYFFIKSQSHYPNDQLPLDYALPTDTPTVPAMRRIDRESATFKRLMELAERHRFMIVFVPPVYRIGEYSPAQPLDLPTPADRVRFLGPPYYLYSPQMFADPVHLNPLGAAAYTRQLAAQFRQFQD
jgi:hypothetical protein